MKIWDIIGVIILIGPLLITVLSILLTFLYTGYEDFVKNQPVEISKRRKLIMFSVAAIIIAGVLYSRNPISKSVQPTTVYTGSSGVIVRPEARFKIYKDPNCLVEVKHINWGKIKPGQSSNKTIYIKNETNSSIYCMVTWNNTSWKPLEAYTYFNITCDFGDDPLKPNNTRRVNLQLYLSPYTYDVDEFEFNIVFTGMTQPFQKKKMN
ncbi:hypothetical protein MCGE09_00090 [Thaumarchaeota archaeon SCGC AB-539-E09]|nr:hypothetical protein MCGE09_00090 [Thaumarchaeota archaeon SCGC AB-539-E09]